MPWHTEHPHAQCPASTPWAVVKDDDGSVAGCHATQEDALAQIAALNAAEGGAAMPPVTFAAHVNNDPDTCGTDLPWSIVDDDSGDVLGCYATEAEATAAVAAQAGPNPPPIPPANKPPAASPAPPPPGGAEAQGSAFQALLAVEGHETADGRMFELDSITWRDLPLPLMLQSDTGPGGHEGAWYAGTIEDIQRDPTEPSRILAAGHFAGPRAADAEQYVRAGLRGVSVDVSGEDVVVEGFEPDSEGFPSRFLERYGDARIMGATVTPFAAFEETQIWMPDEMATPAVVEEVAGEEVPHGEDLGGGLLFLLGTGGRNFGAVGTHETGTTDAPWDGAAQQQKLNAPMSQATARAMYGWIGTDAAEVNKSDAKFPHHMVGDNGQPGVANLSAVSAGIAALNGGRGGTSIPSADKQGVYNHLAKHLRDSGRDPESIPAPNFTDAALVAACAECQPGYRPPARFFTDLRLDGPTPFTVTDQGEIYGHIGLWGTCHVGMAGCVTPEHSRTNYAHFHLGEVICDDGSRIAVGNLSMTTDPKADGHEYDLYASAVQALAHYDNTGLVVADARAGEDRFGPWIHGALRYGLPDSRISALRASKPSGDWRPVAGHPELIHVLMVNSPGFPVPRARVASGRQMALVAAAVPHPLTMEQRMLAMESEVVALRAIVRKETLARLDARARVRQIQELDRRIHR